MNVVQADSVVGRVADAMVSEASLPHGKPGGEAMREAAFDELHGSLKRDVCWSEEQVKVVGHDDVRVQKIAGAVVVDGFEQEGGIAFDLEESATIVSGCGYEVRTGLGGAARDRHVGIVRGTSAAKAAFLLRLLWHPFGYLRTGLKSCSNLDVRADGENISAYAMEIYRRAAIWYLLCLRARLQPCQNGFACWRL